METQHGALLNMVTCINTFATVLLRGGLVGKGDKEEIYCRLMLIVARNFAMRFITSSPDICHWSQPIGLLDFLGWLLPDDDMNSVLSFQRPLPKTRARKTISSLECLGDAFKTAHINFSYISVTPSALSADTLPGFLHDLLRESAALQLKRNQEDWDLLIPMYFGAINHKFDPSLLSAVFRIGRSRFRLSSTKQVHSSRISSSRFWA
ncbi:hypothetical protein BDD12DRAFT_199906 [Trichophaea hybrida]|nr:hypothetical protein BDD12DRAFT_199906 [Trichophaea hybrida]